MNSIVKINSNEGGVFNAQNNRVSFDIPSDKYFDLSSAYLNLVMSCDVTVDPSPAIGVGTYVPVVKMADSAGNEDNSGYSNSVLIRTAKLECELRGSIEEIQRADILTQSLNSYSKSIDMETSQYYEKLIQPYNLSRTKGSLFAELHKEGTIASRNLSRQPVRIKLSDVMNFCKTKQYNTGKYGRTRLELELNLDLIRAPTFYLSSTPTDNDWVMTNSTQLGGGTNEVGRFMNATANAGAGTFGAAVSTGMQTFYVCADTADGAATGIIPRIFNRLEDSPYWVGQKLTINATYAAGAGGRAGLASIVDQVRIITRIDYNRGDGADGGAGVARPGTIAITLDQPLISGAGTSAPLVNIEQYHTIKVRGVNPTYGNGVVADYAELILEELAPANVQPEPDTISYTTFKTEEIDASNVNNFQHTFMAEPNAITMYITQPHNGTNRSLASRQLQLDNYRLRINNKDTSARNIVLRNSGAGAGDHNNNNDPLHTVKQQNALVNSERQVLNLKEKYKLISVTGTPGESANSGVVTDSYGDDAFLAGQVLPMTSGPKQVQVNLTARTGQVVRNLCIFREVLEEI